MELHQPDKGNQKATTTTTKKTLELSGHGGTLL
jgi:hypothetical protein